MITIDLSILNQKGTPMFYSDIFAARPPFGIAGRIFISTDTKEFYRDTGTAWELLSAPGTGTITGGGTATQVAFFNSATSIEGNNDLYWDNVNSRLGIGNNNPASNLDIHGNNATIQIDGRSTSSAFVQFVTQGVSKWRIGNLSPSNYFQIYDNANSLERVKIENTGLFTLTGNVNNNATKTAVNNDGWYGLYTDEVVSIPASTTFTGGNSFGSITGNNKMTFAGNATMPNSAVPAGILSSNVFTFSNALTTLTITQSTGTRAISAVTAFNQVNTIFGSTITHLAGFQVLAPYSQNGTLTATNYFGLLINASNERAGFTITNAWGIYQEGSSDRNYFNGTTLIGTNVDNLSGAKLQVSGAATFSGDITISTSSSPSLFITNTSANGRNYRLVSKDDGNFVIQRTGIADLVTISQTGNIGIGVQPSAWLSSVRALQFSTSGVLWALNNQQNTFLSTNEYLDSAASVRYINNGFATRYQQIDGSHIWYTAPSGTAGNTISFTQAMTLDASGRLGIGTTAPALKLDVQLSTGTGYQLVGSFLGGTNANGNAGGIVLGSTQTYTGYIYGEQTASTGGDLVFGTHNVGAYAERLRITSGGRVLIGTTTDNGTGKLQVTGASTFSSDLYLNDSGHFIFYTGTFIPQCGMFTSGTDLVFFTGTFAEAFRVVSTGIQTQAPTASSAVPWKLGNVSVVSPTSPDRTIAVEVNGTTYYIHAKTTNN
jgi:hypothetical protein